jgi:hypothetical protein
MDNVQKVNICEKQGMQHAQKGKDLQTKLWPENLKRSICLEDLNIDGGIICRGAEKFLAFLISYLQHNQKNFSSIG